MDERLALYIDGEWYPGGTREAEEVVDPATGTPIGTVSHASDDDLDRALAAAERGFQRWRGTPAVERSAILRHAASLIAGRAKEIARNLTREQGKPLAEAEREVLRTAEIFEWYAEEGKRAYGRVLPHRGRGMRHHTVPEPIGPVLALTPWNFPAITPSRKIAAALAAGCSCIIKASEETPASCVALVRACAEAGVPAGVLNLVFGIPARVSQQLLTSPVIRKVSFTGSVPVGKRIAALASEGLKRCTLELGGHAPVVVFDDVEVETVAAASVTAKFRNAGQVCIAPSRFLVQEAIYDRFVERFVAAARSLRVGPGLDPTTQMGPLANPRRLVAMEELVADARTRGGRVPTGGNRIGAHGYFFEPTVLTELPDDARAMTEEPFGPISPIVAFRTFEEAVARANRLPYGLTAYAFTRSLRTATRVSEALDAGTVAINHYAPLFPEAPFGGVKESGYGYEGGAEGLQEYLHFKLVSEVSE